MSYQFYKLLHLSSILFLFMSLGAQALFFIISSKEEKPGIYKSIMISHGVSLLIAFIAGFGLIVKSGLSGGWPGWVYAKFAVWLALGGLVAFNKRVPLPWISKTLVGLGLGVIGIYIAINKPF